LPPYFAIKLASSPAQVYDSRFGVSAFCNADGRITNMSFRSARSFAFFFLSRIISALTTGATGGIVGKEVAIRPQETCGTSAHALGTGFDNTNLIKVATDDAFR
jgi:hypothetical protein